MVQKYPPTKDELKGMREKVPLSEIKFYELLDALSDEWYAWHSVRWDNDTKMRSGEADFLLFNPKLGFVVIEVKGGIISVEDSKFFTINTRTRHKFRIKDPFRQAEISMYHIVAFYIEKAKLEKNPRELLKSNNCFPLNFSHAVFFPDCQFKQDFETIQYSFDNIFDESDLYEQMEWMGTKSSEPSPLEKFLLKILNRYKHLREKKPKTEEFFPKLIGSNISRYISLKKYFAIREEELEETNKVQDFLITALSEKKRCIFKGSAGSGKTFIAMKKAIKNYEQNISTLFICFNSGLRDSIRSYFSEKTGKPYESIHKLISVYSIHAFLFKIVQEMFQGSTKRYLTAECSKFSYKPIAQEIRANVKEIPTKLKYDAILVDEAQDINQCLWDVFTYFLKEPVISTFYVFYDEEQAIFVENFSPQAFGMDQHNDVIVLNKNLRNTVEIANWLKLKTSHGNYEEFSGINGFKISIREFSNAKEALVKTIQTIQNKYYEQGIQQEQVAILSYYKLKTLIPSTIDISSCDYVMFKGKDSGTYSYIIEPNDIRNITQIKTEFDIIDEPCFLFKTITSFKGLEKDILFLIVPKLEDLKKKHPKRIENFLMQLYVGASRAKFKLYFFEYSLD
ncbi:MAG: NERD domain-containing protein [Promethearchaeota archaeon]